MGLTGRQKAAMLLMSLDMATATELLRGLEPKIVQELAVEMAYLDAAGTRDGKQTLDLAREFYSSLRQGATLHVTSFLKEMLRNTVGAERAVEIQRQIGDVLQKRDPFMAIRSADVDLLASALENEHPRAVAVVLSEMPAKDSSAILGLLGQGVRVSAISRMTDVETVTVEAKSRIAETVRRRLAAMTAVGRGGAVQGRPEQSLRKVAVILRNLGKELRDGLLQAIQEKDKEAGEKVVNLMVVWEDIPQIAERSLQEVLRGIDSKELALALHKASEDIVEKIKSNISERAAAMIDEEASLMSAPKKEDVAAAREKIVSTLREMNSKGELSFIEE